MPGNEVTWDTAEVIGANVVRSREVWKVLVEKGVTTETELTLDFFYDSAGAQQDEKLAEFLRRETDYDVALTSERRDRLDSSDHSESRGP